MKNVVTNARTGYLVYTKPSHIQRAGISHSMESNLATLVREAAWLGRVPVLLDAAECLSTWHNLHHPVNSSWDAYLDIENIQIAFHLQGGIHRITLSAITETEFNALAIPASDILKPDNDHAVTLEENTRYRAVVRYLPENILWREQVPLTFDRNAFAHGTAATAEVEIPVEIVKVSFSPSRRIREMAHRVVEKLPDDYCAMHIRRGDNLTIPGLAEATSPRFILQRLDELGIETGSTLFVMTDERRKRYLNLLKKKYRVVRYTDFSPLKSLVTRPGPIDNHLLFLVECEILKHAKVKIHTCQKRRQKQDGTFFLTNVLRRDAYKLPATPSSEMANHRMAMETFLRNPGQYCNAAGREKQFIKCFISIFRQLCISTARYMFLQTFSRLRTAKLHQDKTRLKI